MYQQINKPMFVSQWMQLHWGWHIPMLNTGTPLDILNLPLALLVSLFYHAISFLGVPSFKSNIIYKHEVKT
jgi:hypothetical protein